MKNIVRNKVALFGLSAIVIALFLVANIQAGFPHPILRAVPAQTDWIANGATQYKITVEADSNPIGGQGTRGIEFGYYVPQVEGYTFNLVNVVMHPSDDFFAGYSTFDQNDGSGLIARTLSSSGSGPANRVGNVVEMLFTVSQDSASAANVQTNLEFDSDSAVTYFIRPFSQGGVIAPEIESLPFTVHPLSVTVQPTSVVKSAALACDDPLDC